jgi:hypothetical membrane protein
MGTRYAHTSLITATGWLVLVMLLLPFWSFAGYSLLENTTSHLGAQGSPNAWVMNGTFLVVGVAVQLAGWRKLGSHPLALLLLSIFAISLVLTGLYRHAPLVEGVEANAFEDRRHSLFATTTGFGFVAFAASMAFASRLRRDRAIAVAVAALATLLSLGMAAWPDLMGLFQRAMFLMAFGWLIWVTRDAYPLVDGRR